MYGTLDSLVAHRPAEKGPARFLSPELCEHTDDSITFRVIPGAGHLDLLDQPGALDSIVEWFRERL
jgi:hypothetical protein